ncbi:MAG: pyrroline-5-carboxylate reductase [Planctomycetes bacterium]|nr:pyrroline-5-carboxylate reductase [Planctomycetota bacterium]
MKPALPAGLSIRVGDLPTIDLSKRTLGLLGAGNMAEALARGVLKAGLLPASRVIASDVSPERRALFQKDLGVKAVDNNDEVIRAADLLVLCVKPQVVDEVLAGLKPNFDTERHLLASIAAGVPTARMERGLPAGARTVRIMPNTPMLVGLGASCLCGGTHATDKDLDAVEALLKSCSMVLRVEEPMMDAVTGLSGSGPAYLFYLVEAMTEAGVAEGFTREQALKLAARTCLGAAQMLETTGLDPEELRRRVTSPNGTTQAAMETLDAAGVREKMVAAVRRAAERSRELGRGR